MKKLSSAIALCLITFASSALAETKVWQVTEESESGIKSAQGKWTLNMQGDKLSGTAELELSDGSMLTYKVNGALKDGAYTVDMSDRSDGKKGCVWTGHAPSGSGTQTHGLVGWAPCGGTKLVIRASD